MKKITLVIIGLAVFIGFGIWHGSNTVRNLDGFAVLTVSDPLFYSPYLDQAAFEHGIQELESVEHSLKNTIINNLKEKDEDYTDTFVDIYQQHELFPTDWLHALKVAAGAHENFLADNSETNARELLKAYERAVAAYEASVRSNLEVFDIIDSYMRAGRPLVFFFVDSATTKDIVENDHQLLLENALALKTEIKRRSDCLFGRGECEVLRPSSNIEELFTDFSLEPSINETTADFVGSTWLNREPERISRGPYPIKSECWDGAGVAMGLYATYIHDGGALKIMPKLADQNYYRLVSASSSDPIGQAVLSLGLPFYSQLETTTYECTDLTFYPRLLALDFLTDQMGSEGLTVDDLKQDPKAVLLMENAFGLLPPAFEALAVYTNLLEASQRTGSGFVISPQFLFTTRSAYSLTFMPFAKSVWRLDEKPSYTLSRTQYDQIRQSGGYVTYTELKEQGYTDEEISASHLNQIEVIEGLVDN